MTDTLSCVVILVAAGFFLGMVDRATIPGLTAAGEVAGFGGGGVQGYNRPSRCRATVREEMR